MKSKVVSTFLEYVKFDTCSDEESTSSPSTKKQLELAKFLKEQLIKLGLCDVSMSEFGYVYGTLPANTDKPITSLGFIAHMDTSPDMSGKDVKPNFVENYNGEDIILNKDLNIVLSPKDFPELKNYIGETLITTDGTTLLGADDKAGVAEIVTAIGYLMEHPEIKHGKIRVGFTPDEEVGRGPEHFDVKCFDTEVAYTVDGGALGELEFENFNAAGVKVIVNGRNVHPGYAKNKMKNSQTIAMEFNSMLPVYEVPENTEGYEGFFHLNAMNGDVEKTTLNYILRDFDVENFAYRKELLNKIADLLNVKYGQGTVEVIIKDQYKNMRKIVEKSMHVVDTAFKAMEEVNVTPKVSPIRGGTDGATISFMGIPTPNMFTGGENFHGKYEYIPVSSMEKAVDVIVKIVELYSKKA